MYDMHSKTNVISQDFIIYKKTENTDNIINFLVLWAGCPMESLCVPCVPLAPISRKLLRIYFLA